MNKKDYKKAWDNCPDMWPAYIMIKDVDRLSGMVTYKKGTLLVGKGSDNTFKEVIHVHGGGVTLPIGSVKFLGYVDVNNSYDHIANQFEVLANA